MTAIDEKWDDHKGLLGRPLGGEETLPGGRVRRYQRGAIFVRGRHDPYFVRNPVLVHYDRLQGPEGPLGFPITDDRPTAEGGAHGNEFERGAIVHGPNGSCDVRGRIRSKWSEFLDDRGFLGLPLHLHREEASAQGEVVATSEFQGGAVQWNLATGALSVRRHAWTTPTYVVDIKAVLAAQSDGTNLVNVSTDGFQRWIDEANASFTVAGIRLAWDRTFEQTDNTRLATMNRSAGPAQRQDLRNLVDGRRLLVVCRRGGSWNGGFSGANLPAVVMPAYKNPGLLAHELARIIHESRAEAA